MKDLRQDETLYPPVGLHGHAPALQVICLGNSGGPCEENVTGFLVRSVGSEWARGSLLAVDAGSHMAPIIRILERDFPLVCRERTRNDSNGSHDAKSRGGDTGKVEPVVLGSGPFAGLKFPNASARANALHLLRNYISTYLVTHPHLDHISGFAINTAAFHATSRPKTLAALPSTVDAIKQHIFNDVIWPNLTDEDGGVGFVTFQRLKEGGDVMLGEGEGRGYIDVCDGLGVKAFKVSHGCCTKSPPSHHHRGSLSGFDGLDPSRSMSQAQYSAPGTPGLAPRQSFYQTQQSPRTMPVDHGQCVVDSTSYFVRDCETQREVLIFGDVEPDSISLSPRNRVVWQEAARKIAHGLLGGIFIESSYDDSQADAVLFGHLNPRHLIAELQTLATLVVDAQVMRLAEAGSKKRKRSGPNGLDAVTRLSAVDAEGSPEETKRGRVEDGTEASRGSRRSSTKATWSDGIERHASVSTTEGLRRTSTGPRNSTDGLGVGLPLDGLKVVIIHIKDTLKDGPHVSETILAQLEEHEQDLREEGRGLGCEFMIASSGESYWF